MPADRTCAECGAVIPPGSTDGLCTQCLFSLGLEASDTPALTLPSPDLAPLLAKAAPAIGVKFHYFGDYELLEEIARGGMGVVFRARQISLNRTVALKLITAGQLASEALVRRFHLEAKAAARLDHPNIVPIYEIGEHEGHHYFTMKLLEGGSLAQRLQGEGRQMTREEETAGVSASPGEERRREGGGTIASLSLREGASLLASVARAVHYAHQRGILHRDLKPGNILFDESGASHITDFGLAKLTEGDCSLTHSGMVLGTPSYMSPEQAEGKNSQLTTASDIWSLGAILYELLTGQPGFRGATPIETLRQVTHEEPKPPSALNSAVDRDLETITLKCLEKKPVRRYASAAALADDLEHWLRHEPILARRASTFERLVKWAYRQPVLAAAVVLLNVVLGVGIGGVLWQWRRAEQAQRATTRSNEQLRRALGQMDAIQVQRAEEYMAEERRLDALPRWALVLRNDPSNRIAAERLMSTLSHRTWARLACPPMEHSNRVTFAIFSADGKRVVTSSADNTALVWDAATGQRLAGPFTHSAEINTAVFSPDGRLVVTASQDKTARVWDALTGVPVTDPLPHDADVTTAQFSPDGEVILTTSERLGQLWNAGTGRRVGAAFEASSYIFNARFSPDGLRVALACAGGQVQLWGVAAGTCLHQIRHGSHNVCCVAFSPDGKWLASGSHDQTARVWDVESGQPICEPMQHQDRVGGGTEFSPDGHRIVTPSHDNTAQIWDVRTGQKIGPPLKHTDAVRWAMFSPEGLRVVTASWDKTVRVWDALTGEPLTEPMAHESEMFGAQFSPDGERVLTSGNGNAVLIWKVLGTPALTFQIGADAGRLDLSPDGRRIVFASDGGRTHVWEALTGQPATPLIIQPAHRVNCAVFSPDGELVATASDDGMARIWSASDGRLLTGPMNHSENVHWVVFSSDATRLLTTSGHSATIWDSRNGERLLSIQAEANLSQPASFSPDKARVLTATETGIARVWDARSGEPVTPPMSHATSITSAQFSPDGRFVLTTAREASFFIWDLSTGRRLETRWPHRSPVWSAYYSSDGRRVLSSTDYYGPQVWDLDRGVSLTGELGGSVRIDGAVFSSDESSVMIAYHDNTSQFWDSFSGQRLSEALPHGNRANGWRQCSQDGRFTAVSSLDGKVKIWETPPVALPVPAWLPELAEGLAGQRFNQQGMLERVRSTELWAAQQKLAAWLKAQSAPVAGKVSTHAEFYTRWARWILADASNRTVLPSSPLTLPKYAAQLIRQETFESSCEALRLQPANGLVMAGLARQLIPGKGRAAAYAEWLAARATELAPGHAVTWWTYANWLLATNRFVEALKMMARAEALVPNHYLSKFYNDQAYMMEKAGQWENAIAVYSKSILLTSSPTNGMRQLRRDAFEGRRRLLAHLDRHGEAYHELMARGWIPPRGTHASPEWVDLSRFFNESPMELAIEYHLSEPSLCPYSLDGTGFDVRGCVQLAGSERPMDGIDHPEKVMDIPVNQKCQSLHFLHSTMQATADGAEVGHYMIHYADGGEQRVPIIYGEHVRAFITRIDPARQVKAGEEVWAHADRPMPDPAGNLRFFKSTWKNPRPEVEIQAIDFASRQTRAAPFLVAITVEP